MIETTSLCNSNNQRDEKVIFYLYNITKVIQQKLL